MKEHRIVYIDEQEHDRAVFQEKFETDFHVTAVAPKADLDAFVEELIKANYDAVVSDHKLSESRELDSEIVDYDGVDLIKKIRGYRKDFPCFILTSYDADAITEADDVNTVYAKPYIEDDNPSQGTTTLQERIRLQIEHYQKKIADAKIRLKELLEKHDKETLANDEENELLSLDSFLESNICNWAAIPKEKKSEIAISKVVELLDTTRSLLNNLKENK